MDTMRQEILEIPLRARDIWNATLDVNLPMHVPYLGMGSSYFASLAFKYMGIPIIPEIASEYFNYICLKKQPLGVILSQSGRSSEALWCTSLFEKYIAISNDPNSKLCTSPSVKDIIPLLAGKEENSSSKTYINTLVALFKGFGMDPTPELYLLGNNMEMYDERGLSLADRIYDFLKKEKIHGIYILGSGPNTATALEAALILSESTKLNFHGLPMPQYDHGPKETAKNSIVIQILSKGKSYERAVKLSETIAAAGAHVFTVEETEAREEFSILNNIVPFNFMAYYLSKKLNVKEIFSVGGKVTEVS